MPRTQSRITSRALELAGVDAIPGPKVSDDIQLVYLLGDLSPLMPPLPIVHCSMITGSVGVAAVYSGIDIRPPPGSAIEILALYNGSVTNSEWRLELALDANIVAEATDFTDPLGYVSRCVLRRGTSSVAVQGWAVAANSYSPGEPLPIIVSPGNIFCWANVTVNTTATMRILWREIAVPPQTL